MHQTGSPKERLKPPSLLKHEMLAEWSLTGQTRPHPAAASGLCVSAIFCLRRSPLEMRFLSSWAMCGRLRVGKSFFHVAGLVGAAMCSALDAVDMTAGHNVLPRIRSRSKTRIQESHGPSGLS